MNNWIIYLICIFFLTIVLLIKRKNIKIQPLVYIPLKGKFKRFGIEVEINKKKKKVIPILFLILYKTKLGIKFIDWFLEQRYANIIRKILKITGYVAIGLCVLCMILALVAFGYQLWLKYTTEAFVTSGVMFVLPFKIKGQLYVPLIYWLISIFVIATVHEFGHAISARQYKIPIDATGPAFLCILLPIIPAAFVEPNEKRMEAAKRKKQLSILAMGPTFNIVVGFICLLILLSIFAPITKDMIEPIGMEIDGIKNGELIEKGVVVGDVIEYIYDEKYGFSYTTNRIELKNKLSNYQPGDEIIIGFLKKDDTNEEHTVTLEAAPGTDQVVIGVTLIEKTTIKEETIERYGMFFPKIMLWLHGLFVWLALLNVGIGFFNALPIGLLDGGQMLHKSIKNKKHANVVLGGVSLLFLFLIILSMI